MARRWWIALPTRCSRASMAEMQRISACAPCCRASPRWSAPMAASAAACLPRGKNLPGAGQSGRANFHFVEKWNAAVDRGPGFAPSVGCPFDEVAGRSDSSRRGSLGGVGRNAIRRIRRRSSSLCPHRPQRTYCGLSAQRFHRSSLRSRIRLRLRLAWATTAPCGNLCHAASDSWFRAAKASCFWRRHSSTINSRIVRRTIAPCSVVFLRE